MDDRAIGSGLPSYACRQRQTGTAAGRVLVDNGSCARPAGGDEDAIYFRPEGNSRNSQPNRLNDRATTPRANPAADSEEAAP